MIALLLYNGHFTHALKKFSIYDSGKSDPEKTITYLTRYILELSLFLSVQKTTDHGINTEWQDIKNMTL